MSSLTEHLLSIEKSRIGSYKLTKLYPAALGILNLFLCAYFERFLRHDPSGFYLSLFLLIELILYVGIASTSFITVSFEILSKTRMFPTTSSDRLFFVIKSNLRRPVLFALLSSNAFFLMMVVGESLWQRLVAGMLLTLLLVTCEILLSVTVLFLIRRSVPLGSIVVLFGVIVFLTFTGGLVFHFETLISSIPFIRWTVNGMLATTHREMIGVASNASWLAFTSAACLIVGRKFA